MSAILEQPPKLCRDCTHCAPAAGMDAEWSYKLARCERSATVSNPMTGREEHRFCETERTSTAPEACGPEAKFFDHEVGIIP